MGKTSSLALVFLFTAPPQKWSSTLCKYGRSTSSQPLLSLPLPTLYTPLPLWWDQKGKEDIYF